jgi:hypothetical protein
MALHVFGDGHEAAGIGVHCIQGMEVLKLIHGGPCGMSVGFVVITVVPWYQQWSPEGKAAYT